MRRAHVCYVLRGKVYQQIIWFGMAPILFWSINTTIKGKLITKITILNVIPFPCHNLKNGRFIDFRSWYFEVFNHVKGTMTPIKIINSSLSFFYLYPNTLSVIVGVYCFKSNKFFLYFCPSYDVLHNLPPQFIYTPPISNISVFYHDLNSIFIQALTY